MKCQCCNEFDEQWVLSGVAGRVAEDYHICSNCLMYLVNSALTPEMFFNLLKNGHSTREHLLHDDFYDEDTGKAMQPKYHRR